MTRPKTPPSSQALLVLRHSGLPPTQRLVLLALVALGAASGTGIEASKAELARATGLSGGGALKAIRALERAGWLRSAPTKAPDGGNAPNAYRVTFPASVPADGR